MTRTDTSPQILLRPVENPSAFGIAAVGEGGRVVRLVEKPKDPPSNLALVRVCFFGPSLPHRHGRHASACPGELVITDAIDWLLDAGQRVGSRVIEEWRLDTGKKDDLLAANTTVLDAWCQRNVEGEVDPESEIQGLGGMGWGSVIERSRIRGPVVIGRNCRIKGSFIGPFSSIGDCAHISGSNLQHTVLLENCRITGVERIEDSLNGRSAVVRSYDA